MKEEPNCPSLFIFGAFHSDRIPKATKDVNVYLFIHSFTFRDEIVMAEGLSVKKKKISLTPFPLALPSRNCLLRGNDDNFHSEGYHSVYGSYKKHLSISVIMLFRNLSLSA